VSILLNAKNDRMISITFTIPIDMKKASQEKRSLYRLKFLLLLNFLEIYNLLMIIEAKINTLTILNRYIIILIIEMEKLIFGMINIDLFCIK
jgi:hypothetical protein